MQPLVKANGAPVAFVQAAQFSNPRVEHAGLAQPLINIDMPTTLRAHTPWFGSRAANR
ncbi:MAG: hypothetical protein WD273_13930 [Trueperaceae bacterium]